jgi:osmotically-inducible protein OsmY
MREDRTLQSDVMRELEWDPAVDAAHIGVSVRDGAVTLTGKVSGYAERVHAMKAAERVYGVRAIADELKIELPRSHARDDSAVAEAIAHMLRWNNDVPDTVEAEVSHGLVTLRGKVEWPFQADQAKRAVQSVTGVRGVMSAIVVKPRARVPDLRKRIEDAFERAADLDARRIRITLTDAAVRLEGEVHSLREAELAREAVAAAPGVGTIDDRLAVVP